jgi:hypothetical protein
MPHCCRRKLKCNHPCRWWRTAEEIVVATREAKVVAVMGSVAVVRPEEIAAATRAATTAVLVAHWAAVVATQEGAAAH